MYRRRGNIVHGGGAWFLLIVKIFNRLERICMDK